MTHMECLGQSGNMILFVLGYPDILHGVFSFPGAPELQLFRAADDHRLQAN